MELVLMVLVATCSHSVMGVEPSIGSLSGAIFFTDVHSGDLVRLDHCGAKGCAKPVAIAKGLETFSGLQPWKRSLLAALKSHLVVQVDPWCPDSSCPVTTLVDVNRALGPDDQGSFNLAGLAWCHDSLFIVFGGKSGASGVLRCANCSQGHDCTQGCSLVDGGEGPGKGQRQLSGFPAGIACAGDDVLVADNTNFRIQAIPVGCTSAPCDVKTFASDLKWPLGIAEVSSGKRVLVTLDEGITSLRPDGSLWHKDWSSRGDSGFVCEGDGRIFIASGGDGGVVSFDPLCDGPNCKEMRVWNSTGSEAKSAGAIAYISYAKEPTIVLM